MRLTALPPVRRTVPLKRGSPAARAALEGIFGNRKITLYASGTAALAQAIAQCAARSPSNNPEVIIPAYGCPDLVAACTHASVYPRLVDVAPSHWSYDLEALQASLSPHTVAVVAVNLLGLGDGAAELMGLCRDRHIPLIQDSAQHLPREPREWPGDFVVLSFGRGKPMNLLHGGALAAQPGDHRTLSNRPARYTRRDRLLASRTAALAFNILTLPPVYRAVCALPGTGLGEVTYQPLAETARLPDKAWKQVGIAFESYCQKPSYRRDLWTAALDEWSHLGLAAFVGPDSHLPAEPLRLALLAPDRTARDRLVENLSRGGFGASRFYGIDLPHIAGIPNLVAHQGPFPNARRLAERLFTLPTHALVTAHTVESVRDSVRAGYRAPSAAYPGPSRRIS